MNFERTAFAFTETALDELRMHLTGEAIVPGDAQYDEARQSWNLTVDQHPAVIVVARSAADIAQAIDFARREGLGVSVMSTGHGGSKPADDTLLIVTTQMDDVRIDAATQTAWVEAGVKWGSVLEKAQAVGLAPLLGSSPHVGAIGYTLGGGMGWLGRKYGLSADSVRFFEVATADGRIVRASETENQDLFWALRGGGGSFGVVTGMEIQLYPVTTVYGGNLFYPVENARAVYQHYREWIASAPEELTSSIALLNFPPVPTLPEFLRGKTFVIVRGCYSGPVEQGEALVNFWRQWQAPVMDSFNVMPFSAVATISNEPECPEPAHSTSIWLRALTDEAIETIIRYAVSNNGSSPLTIAEIRHAGGAISRVQPGSAYGNRDAALVLHLISTAPTAERFQFVERYTDEFKRELQTVATGGVYINFLMGTEKWARTKDAYSTENYRRLMTVKAQYDPQNLFDHSFNIPPVEDHH